MNCLDSVGLKRSLSIFYHTLIFHREGRGRGPLLVEYLQAHGLRPVPWEHRVLHDVFEGHDTEYSPEAPKDQREAYYASLAQRVFERLKRFEISLRHIQQP